MILNQAQRKLVESTIHQVCEYKKNRLLAVNCRTNHIHVVVVSKTQPEKVMAELKAWCSRKLNENSEQKQKWWTHHGSTRYLWKQKQLDAALKKASRSDPVAYAPG